jgi:hypothetical protein
MREGRSGQRLVYDIEEAGILYTFLANREVNRLFMTLDGTKEPS